MPVTSKISLAVLLWLAVGSTCLALANPAHSASQPDDQGPAALAAGRRSYEAHCSMCHGLDARGGEHAPGIANSRTVQGESDKALVQTLRQGIPRAGMPSFSYLPDNEIGTLVKYLRSLNGEAKVESLKGDPTRGEKLFFGKAHCGDCHMLAGKGGFIGPDLSDFAVAHSTEKIREAIASPNEKPLRGEEVVNIETAAGQRLSGLVRNEDNFSLQLQDTDGEFHLLMKSQITKVEHTGRSLMPADYGRRLSSADLDDLVSYIAHYGRRVEAPSAPPGERTRRRSH